MALWKRTNYHDDYDESYAKRPVREKREEPLLWVHLTALLVLLAVAFGLVWGFAGREMLEKSLKELATPVGLVWIGLGVGIWFAFVHRQAGAAVWMLLIWLLLTVGGNKFVADGLSHSLEKSWLDGALPAEHAAARSNQDDVFDLLVVPGGGTSINPSLRPQLSSAGDRILTAASLYHAGKAKRVCVTGEQGFRSVAEDPDPAEEARSILQSVGIPPDAIVALRGLTTSEEIAFVSDWLKMQPGSETWRIGLVTSAWHMSRATALADAAGLKNVVPLPCNFVSQPFVPEPSIVIPSAAKLDQTARMLHEYLGRWLGR